MLDNPQRNKIFELKSPPSAGCPNLAVVCNPPVATITTVSNPVGLAVTDASAASTDCVNSSTNPGCTLLGGTVTVGVTSANPNASVIALSCTIDDPRITPMGDCGGQTLLVSDYCPGYPHITVPAYLCGASGASGHAMTFLKFEEANGDAHAPHDLVVNVELAAEAILGTGGGTPHCPQLATGWAPLASEGTIPETTVEMPLGVNRMMEPTSYCGSTRQLTPGHSLMLVGAQISFDTDLVALANEKFDRLSDTVSLATNMSSGQAALQTCVDHGKTLFNAISLKPANRNACAAHQAWTCDQTVVPNQFVLNTDKLSNLSAIKGRLENLIMHIDNRIIAPGSTPPVPPQPDPLPGAATVATCDITPPTAPSGPGFNEDASDGTNTTYTVSWTASTDLPGEVNSSNPGPYSSGVQRYHVYLDNNNVDVTGSPTAATSLQFTITDTSPASHSVTITADDNATGGVSPVFNTSAPAALTVQCTDQDTDNTCDVVTP